MLSSEGRYGKVITPQLFVCGRGELVIIVVSVSGKPLFRTRCNAVYKLYTLPTTEYAQETMHYPSLPDLFSNAATMLFFAALGAAELVVHVCVCVRACCFNLEQRKSARHVRRQLRNEPFPSLSPSLRHDAFNILVTVPEPPI